MAGARPTGRVRRRRSRPRAGAGARVRRRHRARRRRIARRRQRREPARLPDLHARADDVHRVESVRAPADEYRRAAASAIEERQLHARRRLVGDRIGVPEEMRRAAQMLREATHAQARLAMHARAHRGWREELDDIAYPAGTEREIDGRGACAELPAQGIGEAGGDGEALHALARRQGAPGRRSVGPRSRRRSRQFAVPPIPWRGGDTT